MSINKIIHTGSLKRLFLIIVTFLFISIFLYSLFSLFKNATTFEPDFSIFYTSVLDITKGISPYTDHSLFTLFNYPVATTTLFIPFSLFSYKIAQILFTICNFVGFFLLIYSVIAFVKKEVTLMTFLLAISIALLAFPTKFTFGMGQVNIIAFLLIVLGFLFFQKNKLTTAITFLIIGILLKPILGFLLLVFIFEKNWQFLGKVIFFLLAIILLIPVLINQPNANWIFLQNITHQSLLGREVYYNQGLLGFISRIASNVSLRFYITFLISLLLMIIVLIKQKSQTFVKKASLLTTLLLIIDPLSWQHHFVFLLLPFIVVWESIEKKKNPLFFALFVLSYLLVLWNFKSPQYFSSFPLSLLLSNQFYSACILFIMQLIL